MVNRTLLIVLCFFNAGYAQDFSGLWVHDIDGTSPSGFSEIYGIMYLSIDDSNKVKGFTYDYQDGDWCSFYLEGNYDSAKKRLRIVNTIKIRKPFTHARCKYKLFYEVDGGEEFFVGKARQKGIHGFILSFGGVINIALNYRKIMPDNFKEIKGYDVLKPYIDALEVNLEKDPEESHTIEENLFNDLKEKEETQKIIDITNEKENRKNELINSHKVKSRKITIEILDNNRPDGDRISIFINDKLIEYNLEVTKNPKVIEVVLPKDKKTHNVFFVANNVGNIAPNTAKIRYSLNGIYFEEALFTNFRTNKFLEFTLK